MGAGGAQTETGTEREEMGWGGDRERKREAGIGFILKVLM
jgi:hypothetical protein